MKVYGIAVTQTLGFAPFARDKENMISRTFEPDYRDRDP